MTNLECSSRGNDVEEVLSTVTMDHVLMEYEHLLEQIEILHPSQLEIPEVAALKGVSEDAFILLPSPFERQGGGRHSVVVLLGNNYWTDCSGLRPANIPPDPVGFVMAYERCSYEQALEKIRFLADEMRGSEEMVNSHVAQIRGLTAVCAEAALARGRGLRGAAPSN
jgi:hypothetical protein